MNLLFAHADDGRPVLNASADPKLAAGEAHAEPVKDGYLADVTADANLLETQRWALVVPEGAEGERLEALVRPLVDKRRADQGGVRPLILRAPCGMDALTAMHWKKDVFPGTHGNRENARPRYLLILGDMGQVSLATQQVLADDGFPGRLVCPNDEGYAAYVDKVLAWERTPSEMSRARALFYTVQDGTAATRSAHDQLVHPCFQRCIMERNESRVDFWARTVESHGHERPRAAELRALAAAREPSVLFSVSHGLGPPRRRPWSVEEARRLQGAMCFGAEDPLLPEDVHTGPFLPGGLWIYFACFGAGTPRTSAYAPWLRMLRAHGMAGLERIEAALMATARGDGFTCGLAQAALANPDGPLALLGHVDLAWSFGYALLRKNDDGQTHRTNRAACYFQLLAKLIQGERAGAAYRQLQQDIDQVGRDLSTLYDRCKRRGVAPEGASDPERFTLGNLWMLRQDLRGYVLLGDPAVRLPLAPVRTPAARKPGFGFSRGVGSAGEVAPSDPHGEGRMPSSTDRALVHRVERAILAQAAGGRSPSQTVAGLPLSPGQVRHLGEAYHDAGRRALARLLFSQSKSA